METISLLLAGSQGQATPTQRERERERISLFRPIIKWGQRGLGQIKIRPNIEVSASWMPYRVQPLIRQPIASFLFIQLESIEITKRTICNWWVILSSASHERPNTGLLLTAFADNSVASSCLPRLDCLVYQ